MTHRNFSRINIRDRMPPASDHTGMGTCDGDWSSIRDSSDDARNRKRHLIRRWWFRDLRWLLKRLLRQHQLHCSSLRKTGGCAYGRDRASIVAAGVMQIVATASEHERQQTIADYLRDELGDIERQARTDLDIPD